jgi:hypothetical protein
LNADACLNTARRETGATKRRKTKPTTNTTTKIPFQTTNQRKNKTCETCDPTKFEVSYIFNNTPQRKALWPDREEERESTLTACHTCHRTRIPFRHVLIERRCFTKHCNKRDGCNKEKKDQTHHTNNNSKGPVSNHKQEKNNTCETCDPTNLELSYIFNNTPQRKAPWPQRRRESECTYCVTCLSPHS